MGCSISKLDPDEQSPSGLRPSSRRRQLRRRLLGRSHKDSTSTSTSTASSTEVLQTESSEIEDDHLPPLPGAEQPRLASKLQRVGGEEEELPGSPSFRFYFDGPVEQRHPIVLSQEDSIKDSSTNSSV